MCRNGTCRENDVNGLHASWSSLVGELGDGSGAAQIVYEYGSSRASPWHDELQLKVLAMSRSSYTDPRHIHHNTDTGRSLHVGATHVLHDACSTCVLASKTCTAVPGTFIYIACTRIYVYMHVHELRPYGRVTGIESGFASIVRDARHRTCTRLFLLAYFLRITSQLSTQI